MGQNYVSDFDYESKWMFVENSKIFHNGISENGKDG